jgi:hypothetical protein
MLMDGKPLYVIVHAAGFLQSDVSFFAFGDLLRLVELHRVVREERKILVEGNPSWIPENLPNNKESPIRVCGGLRDVCVNDQYEALQSAGYTQAAIYEPASIIRIFEHYSNSNHNV